MDFLQHFSGTPRPAQQAILEQLARDWDHYDVFVIRASVATGKSRIAHAVASAVGDATITVPNNLLTDQYLAEWPDLTTPQLRSRFRRAQDWDTHKAGLHGPGLKLANYYSYLAHRLYSRVVIADEAHRLIPHLTTMEQVSVWQHLAPIPDWCTSATDLQYWLHRTDPDALGLKPLGARSLRNLKRKLGQNPDGYILRLEDAEFRGRQRRVLRLVPLTPRENRPILWPPSRVQKLVFMSATFHEEDIDDLGLSRRRVRIYEADSPIPADRRPVVYEPVGSLGRRRRAENLEALVRYLEGCLAHHSETKGMVHCTYALASELRRTRLGDHPRLRWHTAEDRTDVYQAWRDAPGPEVLIGCGLSEGVDLAGEAFEWQVIAKVQYPDLSDPAVAALARQRPNWYKWQAVKHLLQATGRICRGPDDFGVTYIADAAFKRLYGSSREMFPKYFQEALR